MKLIIAFMSLFWVAFSTPSFQSQYVEDFEKGFKYVRDHQQELAGMTGEELLSHLRTTYGVSQSIQIQTLDEVLQQGSGQWSAELNRMLRELNSGIFDSQSFEDFLRKLVIFENDANGLNSNERQAALLYIRNFRDILMLFHTTLQYYNNCCDANTVAWWPKWGRCVAGILGGTGSGALAGAAIGAVSAVGIGAIPGGIIGGISGGLTAAASFC
jgi:hypothetical protein